MKNIFITIQYDGSRYSGWQRQGNTDNTIENKISSVLKVMLGNDDDIEIHVSKIKIEGHDYYKVASKLNRDVSIEHLTTCKKCYDIFD